MKSSLSAQSLASITERVRLAHERFHERYPGKIGGRQPVHTFYLGAHEFREGTLKELGDFALRFLDEFAPDFVTFAKAIGLPGSDRLPESADAVAELIHSAEAEPRCVEGVDRATWLSHRVYSRVREKLHAEPIEDLRIDFEDGYGHRADEEEDGHANTTAIEVAKLIETGELPLFGIRIKPFAAETLDRSIRTLDIFLTTLAGETRAAFPKNFLITLAKVSLPEEVSALAQVCSLSEQTLGLAPGTLRIELMIETTQSVLNERGEVNILPLLSAGGGRCIAAHFGTYDYTAGRNLAPACQHMLHPACDFAREMMQVATSGTGIWLSDGGTNVLPFPVRNTDNEDVGADSKRPADGSSHVYRGWKLHFNHVRHSLENGFYQGWDLHPAQLPTRYAAVYSFFLENLDAASERLRAFVDKMSETKCANDVMDDAATGQALLNYFLRALNCGAIAGDELLVLTGLTEHEIRTGSFSKILAARRG